MSEIEKTDICKATHEEICDKALEHYTKISIFAGDWMSTVPHAIGFYRKYKDHVYALEEKVKELEKELEVEFLIQTKILAKGQTLFERLESQNWRFQIEHKK